MNKIIIDVDEDSLNDANIYFESYFADFWKRDMLQIIGQKPTKFVVNGKEESDSDNLIAGKGGKSEPLHQRFIQAGNTVIALQSVPCDKDLAEMTGMTLTEIKKRVESDTKKTLPCGTAAGYVQDKDGDIYLLTARHVLKGTVDEHENVEPNPGTEPDNGDSLRCGKRLPVVTQIFADDTMTHYKVHVIGSEYFGSYGSTPEPNPMALDFALVKVTDSIKEDTRVRLCPRNQKDEEVKLKVFEEGDEDMYNKDVQKFGINTGLTVGNILPISRNTTVNGVECGGTFAVQSRFEKDGKTFQFSKLGDSGALVTSTLGENTNGVAFGMCYRIQDEYKYLNENKKECIYKNVTWCTRLNHAFKFAEKKWDIKYLQFCGPVLEG